MPKNHAIRILIADDHPVVRVGLRNMLSQAENLEIVGEASSLSETIDALVALAPDVTVLDMVMGDVGGLETLRRVQATAPRARIVIYTAHSDIEYAMQALDLGVQGYLLKDSPHPGLALAIRIVNEGGTFIDPNISRELVGHYKTRIDSPTDSPQLLTEREHQVLRFVAEGISNRGIAEKLCISERTVKFHVSSILGKLGAQNRTEAVRIADRRELLLLADDTCH